MKIKFNSYNKYLKYLNRNYFSHRWMNFHKRLYDVCFWVVLILPFIIIGAPGILTHIFSNEINVFMDAFKINPIAVFGIALSVYLGTTLCITISLANQKDPIFRQNKLVIFFKIRLITYVDMSLIMVESIIVALSALIGSFFNLGFSVIYSLLLIIYSVIFIVIFIKFASDKNNSQCKMILQIKDINVLNRKKDRYFCNYENIELSKHISYDNFLSNNILRRFKGETDYLDTLYNLINHNVPDIYDSCEFTYKYISTVFSKNNFVCFENLLSYCLLIKYLNVKIFPSFNNGNMKEYYRDLLNSLCQAINDIFKSKYFKTITAGINLIKAKRYAIYDKNIDKKYRDYLSLHEVFLKIAVNDIKKTNDKFAFNEETKNKEIYKVLHDIEIDLKTLQNFK